MKGGHRGGRILTFQPIYPENSRRGSSRATIRFVDLINFAEARNWRGWTLCNRACPPSLCASPLGKIFFLFLSLFFSVSRVIFTILTLVEIREVYALTILFSRKKRGPSRYITRIETKGEKEWGGERTFTPVCLHE